jgi:uncharacterized membrane protein YbhN (UPF0104 family)
MLRFLRAVARFCQDTIGWNRLGFILSATIIGVAVTVLYRTLHNIEVHEVFDALHATKFHHILAAGGFVAGGYFTLTFYDWFAVRAIGRKDISYRIAALGGFTSYAVGHNIGATVFTGGAVRYRVYSAHGLDAIEVAKICFIAGLTFWLGNAAVLGLGVTWHPGAATSIDQLPPWINRCIGVAILAILASYVGWVWSAPRQLGRGGWTVQLPNGPTTLLQIGIGILDLACCALAMYMLLPGEPNIGFVTLAVIFVTATMLGFASHAPGGLGVFDATMLVALWEFDKEDLLAGLLLFRLLYYITPFAIALVMLGVRELMIYRRGPGTLPPPQTVDTAGPVKSELERTGKNTKKKS